MAGLASCPKSTQEIAPSFGRGQSLELAPRIRSERDARFLTTTMMVDGEAPAGKD
jgi:hypothetical protein